jgi:nucleotide-binding universal stress UspA family protein
MSTIRHILVATDGSEGARKAATFAGELARGLGAHVTVLIVHSEDVFLPDVWGPGEWPVPSPYAGMSVDELRELFERHASEHELPATTTALGALPTSVSICQRWGHAAETICGYAVDSNVDLIVIGSHGRRGLSRLLLGSISHQVANHATCPVTIVR